MYIYREKRKVPQEGLSAQHLFWLLQEAAGAHSGQLGFGESDMRGLGIMWVVIRYLVKAERWPSAGEELTVETWPGQVRHGMCPRFYRILDADGAAILTASCLWAVVDRETRQMVSPLERGVTIEALVTGDEAPLPGTVRRPVTDREMLFTVPEAYVDSNGHMNNTCYFDLAEQCTGFRADRRGLREVTAEYLNEALCGNQIRVHWGVEGSCCTVVGEKDSSHVFRMRLLYQ